MQEKFKKMFSLQNCAKSLSVTTVDQRSYSMAKEILNKNESFGIIINKNQNSPFGPNVSVLKLDLNTVKSRVEAFLD